MIAEAFYNYIQRMGEKELVAMPDIAGSDADTHAGDAAEIHLSEGRPIYYSDPEISTEHPIRERPDGSRELVGVDWEKGTAFVIRKL